MSYGFLEVRSPQLVVYGAGGFAREVCWLAESCPDAGVVVAMVDDDPTQHGTRVNGIPVFGLAEALRAQGKTTAASEIDRQFRAAWATADVKLRVADL